MSGITIIFTGLNRKWFTVIAFLVTMLPGPMKISGQKVVDDDLKTLFNKGVIQESNYSRPLKEANNEIKFITGAAFLVYKTFISSQDRPSCVFTPSCSEYAVEALNKKGLFAGWLYTFDRLSRCHGFVNRSHYVFSTANNRFYDPLP